MKAVNLETEVGRLQAQRNRAWITLGEIQAALIRVNESCLIRLLNEAVCSADYEEWRQVVEATEASGARVRNLSGEWVPAGAVLSAEAKMQELRKFAKLFVPRPETMSGWEDEDLEGGEAVRIEAACGFYGVGVPLFVAKAADAAGGE